LNLCGGRSDQSVMIEYLVAIAIVFAAMTRPVLAGSSRF
jgi:hypothetical protein